MLFATDTSTLIVLRKLDWLNLCSLSDTKIIWPRRVTQELRQQKSKNQKILALLNSHQTEEIEAHRPLTLSEISQTDADVISLAAEWNCAVLSEDKVLRQKAMKLGIATFAISTLVTRFYRGGAFTKDECQLDSVLCTKRVYCPHRSITNSY